MIKIWQNTHTLDGFIDDLFITDSKKEAEIALLGGKPIQLSEFPNLKGIFRAGISRDNVPIDEAQKRNIEVAFPSQDTVEIIYEETANFTCYLILRMFYQNLGTLEPWEKFPRGFLGDKKLLVIGTGNIGSRVITKMKGFLKVFSFDVANNSELDFISYLKNIDCVSLHIPNTLENKNFLNSSKLSLLKDSAIVINTARGAVVSEDDLYNELKHNRLYAAFDVFWEEPYKGKLKEFYPDRFYMTPHVASTCTAFLEGAANDLRKLVNKLDR